MIIIIIITIDYYYQADIAGYGWRAPYVLAGIPGLLISVLLCFAVKDPR